MALPLNQKLHKQMEFLIGARHPAIYETLTTRGFNQETLDEGWSLLTVAAGAKLRYRERTGVVAASPARRSWAPSTRGKTRLPLARAVLERHFPALAEAVFINLHQTSGAEVVLSVGTLLERLDAARGQRTGRKQMRSSRSGTSPPA